MITVVIPVRNRAAIVGRTLDSVASQTRIPDQIVLVDNASTDGTLEVLQRWAEGRENVTVLGEPRLGAAEARNCGLNVATEEYVMFFDSDDVMPPRHVEEVCSELERLGMPDIGAFGMECVRLDGSVVRKNFGKGDPMFNHIFHSTLSTQRYVVRTEFIRSAGGWIEQTPVWNDFLLGVILLSRQPNIKELKVTERVKIYAQEDSITGKNFSSKAGKWEATLDSCVDALRQAGLVQYEPLINYRRAILAGKYISEGHPEFASGLMPTPMMRLIARYVAAGGRGVAYIARISNCFRISKSQQ